jgi:UDP-N-acetylmuramoylalanine--D-glutamate ligase
VTSRDISLLGKHNWQNVCAAVTAVWQITQDVDAISNAINEFTGLPHRIEFVCEKNGIRYYNDSFATGLHATVAAINAISEPKVVIVGGYDRMLNIDDFGTFLKNDAQNVKHIVLIGDSKDRVANLFNRNGIQNYTVSKATNIHDIVNDAREYSVKGDAIVFSPGFASFGLFKNFEERGISFKEEVAKL